MTQQATVRAVAYVEAIKGMLVLAVSMGLTAGLHKDVHATAVHLVEHLHLNPASKYPQIFLEAASHLGDTRLLLLAVGAFAYASIRLIEAFGLFYGRAWAEVLSAGSGALYVPFEVAELLRHPSWHGALLLAVNMLVVGIMVHALSRRRAESRTRGAP